MARFPGGTWKPLPENETQSAIVPTQLILHTAVDQPGPTRLERYFARTDITVESHFWIPLDGEVVQMMDTEVRADANRRANRRPDGTGAISIETEDEGNPVGVPWTDAQIDSIIAVALWVHEEHGIPLAKCTGPAEPGLTTPCGELRLTGLRAVERLAPARLESSNSMTQSFQGFSAPRTRNLYEPRKNKR